MSKHRSQHPTEDAILHAIEEKALFDEFYPVIREIIKAGGGADNILKKSEPYAAVTMASLLKSDKAEVRMAAAKNILERVSGKAVERSVNLNFDPTRLSSKDLDSQIKKLMKELGPKTFTENVLEVRALPPKQKRKPKKSKLIEDVVVEVVPSGEYKPSE